MCAANVRCRSTSGNVTRRASSVSFGKSSSTHLQRVRDQKIWVTPTALEDNCLGRKPWFHHPSHGLSMLSMDSGRPHLMTEIIWCQRPLYSKHRVMCLHCSLQRPKRCCGATRRVVPPWYKARILTSELSKYTRLQHTFDKLCAMTKAVLLRGPPFDRGSDYQ